LNIGRIGEATINPTTTPMTSSITGSTALAGDALVEFAPAELGDARHDLGEVARLNASGDHLSIQPLFQAMVSD
jgi:hypothetical protein